MERLAVAVMVGVVADPGHQLADDEWSGGGVRGEAAHQVRVDAPQALEFEGEVLHRHGDLRGQLGCLVRPSTDDLEQFGQRDRGRRRVRSADDVGLDRPLRAVEEHASLLRRELDRLPGRHGVPGVANLLRRDIVDARDGDAEQRPVVDYGVCVDDDAIRALVTRLARAHPSGGTVIERAAIVAAAGAGFEAVTTWIVAHGGEPEATVETSARHGLHGSRRHASGGSEPRAPSRFVLPAGALD